MKRTMHAVYHDGETSTATEQVHKEPDEFEQFEMMNLKKSQDKVIVNEAMCVPRIRYAQCWEDPKTLDEGLNVTEKDDVVSIASGGDNTFALLLRNPKSLVAVDVNPAQIHLMELKIRAMQLLDYDDFVGFIGARPFENRRKFYSIIRQALSDKARWYWDQHPEDILKGIIHCGKFEHYFSIFRWIILPLIHYRSTVQKILTVDSLEKQLTLYHDLWNTRRWRWFFQIFFGKFVLGYLGRDPLLFRYVTLPKIADELLRRTRYGLTEIPSKDNFFLEYMLTGTYNHLETAHPYLRESNFAHLKELSGKIQLYVGGLEGYLDSLNPGSRSRFNLSDISEYQSDEDFERLLLKILRASRDEAALAFWTLFVPRGVPLSLTTHFIPQIKLSNRLFAADRTFFYGSFNVWKVMKTTEYQAEL